MEHKPNSLPQIPSLKKYFKESSLNMKETLSAYLRSIKKDPDMMWEKIEEAIANVYVNKQPHISKLSSIVGDQRSDIHCDASRQEALTRILCLFVAQKLLRNGPFRFRGGRGPEYLHHGS